ncbi:MULTISPECIES: Ig-like domain-containing protein [Blautia]|uniref:Ig-like domain-containing protein n=1 Tax=Blautia TaxID=572511 RepID=UPI000BA47CEB|nr:MULTISPECIES: Ig-like domain-containing protein [Blautia]
MRKRFQKAMAWILVILMTVTYLPMDVLASQEEQGIIRTNNPNMDDAKVRNTAEEGEAVTEEKQEQKESQQQIQEDNNMQNNVMPESQEADSNSEVSVTSLSITRMPYRLSYYCNSALDNSVSIKGIELLASYSDGHTEVLDTQDIWTIQDSYGNILDWKWEYEWLQTPGEYEITLRLEDAVTTVPIRTKAVSEENISSLTDLKTALEFEQNTEGDWFAPAILKIKEAGTYVVENNIENQQIDVYTETGEYIDNDWRKSTRWHLKADTTYIFIFKNWEYEEGQEYDASAWKSASVEKVEIINQPYTLEYVQYLDASWFSDGLRVQATYDNGEKTVLGYAEDGEYIYYDKYGSYLSYDFGNYAWWEIISEPGEYSINVFVEEIAAEEPVRLRVLPVDEAVTAINVDEEFFFSTVPSKTVWKKFIPEKSGKYNLSASSWLHLYVYDQAFECVIDTYDIKTPVELEAGDTYYIGFQSSSFDEFTGKINEIPNIKNLTMIQEPVKKSYIERLDRGYFLDGLELELTYEDDSTYIMSYEDIGYEEWVDPFGNTLQIEIRNENEEGNWWSQAGNCQMILSIQDKSVSVDITVEEISGDSVPVLTDTDQIISLKETGSTYVQFTPEDDGTYGFRFDRDMNCYLCDLDSGNRDEYYFGTQFNLQLTQGTTCYMEVNSAYSEDDTEFSGKVISIPSLEQVEIISGPDFTEYVSGLTDGDISIHGLQLRLVYSNGETTSIEYQRHNESIDKYGTQVIYRGIKESDAAVLEPGVYTAVFAAGSIIQEVPVTIKAFSDVEVTHLEENKTVEGKSGVGYQYFSFTPPEDGSYQFRIEDGKEVYWKEEGGPQAEQMWVDNTSIELKKGCTYVFGIKSTEKSVYEITLNRIPKVESIKIKEMSPTEFYYGAEDSAFNMQYRCEIIYENGEREICSRYGTTKYGMSLQIQSPYDNDSLKDKNGLLPVGEYDVSICLGEASAIGRITVLPLDGAKKIEKDTNIFLDSFNFYKFIPDETGNYQFKANTAMNVSVYDSNMRLYTREYYEKEMLLNKLKGGSVYYILAETNEGKSNTWFQITRSKEISRIHVDTADIKTEYTQNLDSVDFDHLHVNVFYEDGTQETFKSIGTNSEFSIDYENIGEPLVEVGTYPVTVSYKGVEDTFDISCIPMDTTEFGQLEEGKLNTIKFSFGERTQIFKFIPSETRNYIFSSYYTNGYGNGEIQVWDDSGNCIIEKNPDLHSGVLANMEGGREYLVRITGDNRNSLDLRITKAQWNIKSMEFQESSIKDYYLFDSYSPGSDEYEISVDVVYEDGHKETLKDGEYGRYGRKMVLRTRLEGRNDSTIKAEYMGKTIYGNINLCGYDEAPLKEVFLGDNIVKPDRRVNAFKFLPEEDGTYYYEYDDGNSFYKGCFFDTRGNQKNTLEKGKAYYLTRYVYDTADNVKITVKKAKEIKEIKIKSRPAKTVYVLGRDNSLSNEGLVLSVTYTDGTARDMDFTEFRYEGIELTYPNLGSDLYGQEPGEYKGVVSSGQIKASFDIQVLSLEEGAESIKMDEVKVSDAAGSKLYRFTPETDGYYWYPMINVTMYDGNGQWYDPENYASGGENKALIHTEAQKDYYFKVDYDTSGQEFQVTHQKMVSDIQIKDNTVFVMANTDAFEILQPATIVYEDGTKESLNLGEASKLNGASLEISALIGTGAPGMHVAVVKYLHKKINCNLQVVTPQEYGIQELSLGKTVKIEQENTFLKFKTSDKTYYRFLTDSKSVGGLYIYENDYFNDEVSIRATITEKTSGLVLLKPDTIYYLKVVGLKGDSLGYKAVSGIKKLELERQEELYEGDYINNDVIRAFYSGTQFKITDTDGNTWTEEYDYGRLINAIFVEMVEPGGVASEGGCEVLITYGDKQIIDTIPIVKPDNSKYLIDLGDGGKGVYRNNRSRWNQVFKITPSMDGLYKINISAYGLPWYVRFRLIDENGKTYWANSESLYEGLAREFSLEKGKTYYIVLMSYASEVERAVNVEVVPKSILVPVKELKLSASQIDFTKPGDTKQLTASVTPSNATNKTVIWVSSDETVAKVSGGKVTAAGPGTCVITASAGGVTASCKVTVKAPAEKISLNKTSATVYTGKTYTLSPELTPSNSTDTVTWTSSNTKVAKVSSKGVVTGVAKGTATITAKTTSGKAAVCKVTVKTAATKVTLSKTSVTVNKGKTYTLKATMSPSGANDSLQWSSSNSKVVKVSASGVVTGVAKGSATITVKTGSGKTASCKVTVKVPSTKVSLSKTSISVNKGKTYTLKGTLSPSDSTDSLKWSSSNTKIAKVSSSGIVTGIEKGSATITVKATSGKTASCKVTVKIPSAKVTMSKTSVSVNVGKTYTLKGTMSPSNTTDTLKWTSSDTKIAKVSSAGVVTAVAKGNATITVKTTSGKTATCKVTVKVPSTKVTMNKTSVSVNVGKTYTLKGTMSPSNTTDIMKWSSSNTKVAKVSSAGVVTALAKGSATITVKTTSGKTATCKVTVKVPSTKVAMSKTSVSINVGKTYTLKGTMSPGNTTDTLKWSSSNTKIAKVSSAGVVTAVAKGSATITVKTTSGKAATCKVTVKVPSTKVAMNKTSASINVGKTYTLKGTMSPSNTTDTMKWSSSNTKIAKVSSAGVVTAVAKGTAMITVKTTSGKSATCKVTVKVPSTKVSVSKTSVSINKGKTYTLKGTMSPGNTTDTLKWSSSNTKVAKVSSSGVVTAVEKGTATITVKATSGKSATCKVTVKIPSTKVALSKASISIYKGKTYTLKGTLTPGNATDTLKWSSSNTKSASVSSSGVVKGISAGTSTITVKTSSGKTATCKVTVKEIKATSVKFESGEINLISGQSAKVGITVLPANTTDDITWSSSDESIVRVSADGTISAGKEGEAFIEAKASGGKKSSCKVIVSASTEGVEE